MDNTCTCNNTVAEYAVPFAIWDLRLYLDTHPDDAEALALYSSLCTRAGAGMHIHIPAGATHWSHIDGPWPWEPDANIAPSSVCTGASAGACKTGCRAYPNERR